MQRKIFKGSWIQLSDINLLHAAEIFKPPSPQIKRLHDIYCVNHHHRTDVRLLRSLQENCLNSEVVEQIYKRNPILRYSHHPLHSPLLPLPYGDIHLTGESHRSETSETVRRRRVINVRGKYEQQLTQDVMRLN